jgi:hypothetical protein
MSPANPKRTLVAQAGLHSGTGPLLGFPTFPEDYFKNFGALRMMARLSAAVSYAGFGATVSV